MIEGVKSKKPEKSIEIRDRDVLGSPKAVISTM